MKFHAWPELCAIVGMLAVSVFGMLYVASRPQHATSPDILQHVYATAAGEVAQIELKDGTKCVIAPKGIHCDWSMHRPVYQGGE